MDAPSAAALIEHLVASRIAGNVATPRDNNVGNFAKMAAREPLYLFGLQPQQAWTFEDVLALMAKRCGVSPDPEHREGQDTIDPALTVDRLDAMAERIGVAAQRRERVFVATGHPVGLRPTHSAVVRALAGAGCTMLTPVPQWTHPDEPAYEGAAGGIVYLDGVAAQADLEGRPRHTHSPLPMLAVLQHLADAGEAPPDLVVADHGWAGAAGQAGIDAVGFADCNDPALFVGEAEGKVIACVPLDDNVAPHLYAPLTAYLLARAGVA